MRCEDCLEALNAYVDDELMPTESEAVRRHLLSCDECDAEHETLRSVSQRVKPGLERFAAPDLLKARIRSALAQPNAFDSPRRLRTGRWPVAIAFGLFM